MPIHQGPPPGYLNISGVAERLGMSRQNFYRYGLADEDFLPSWKAGGRLWRRDDINKLAYWLAARKGLIALGVLPYTTPIKPDFDLDAWFDDDHYGIECPVCGGQAFTDWGEPEKIWCESCGLQT